jgi:hypothetical protein
VALDLRGQKGTVSAQGNILVSEDVGPQRLRDSTNPMAIWPTDCLLAFSLELMPAAIRGVVSRQRGRLP